MTIWSSGQVFEKGVNLQSVGFLHAWRDGNSGPIEKTDLAEMKRRLTPGKIATDANAENLVAALAAEHSLWAKRATNLQVRPMGTVRPNSIVHRQIMQPMRNQAAWDVADHWSANLRIGKSGPKPPRQVFSYPQNQVFTIRQNYGQALL